MSACQVTKKNLWFYYNKLLNFEAQCICCKNIYAYIDFEYFSSHLRDKHKENLKLTAKDNLRERPYIYFNRYDSKCLICDKDIQYDNFTLHLHASHFKDDIIMEYEIRRNAREFWQPDLLKIDDGFTGQCALCKKMLCLSVSPKLDLHIQEAHLELLNIPLEEVVISMPSIITNEIELWKHYTKLDYNFQAKCNRCTFQTDYIKTTNIIQHIKQEHPQVISYEETAASKCPWIYFKYHFKKVQCLICHTFSTMDIECLKFHMHHLHRSGTFNHERYNCNWMWKYLKISDKEIKCTLLKCTFEMSVELELSHFDRHTHIHSKIDSSKANISKLYDVDESSGNEPQRMKTDDSSKD